MKASNSKSKVYCMGCKNYDGYSARCTVPIYGETYENPREILGYLRASSQNYNNDCNLFEPQVAEVSILKALLAYFNS